MSAAVRPVPCVISPKEKGPAKRVGDDLVRDYGKRKFCTVDQVRESKRRAGIALDMECWSYAMFNTHGPPTSCASATKLDEGFRFLCTARATSHCGQCSSQFRNSIVITVSGASGFLRNFRHRFA